MSEPSMGGRKTIVNAALLRDFVDGKLDAKLEAKVVAFVEQHPSLMSKLEAMSGGDFMNRLRSAYGVVPDRSLPGMPKAASEVVPERVQQEPPESQSKPVATLDVPQELSNLSGYEIMKELGRGGMGVVYLAKNITLDRLEVLKVLNDRLHQSAEAKERFIREVRAVSRLSHPAIVTSFSVLPSPSAIVFAMEYVEGMDLHKFIHRNTPLPIATCCSIAQQVAGGLQHGHDRGLVHRDIKPSNIMIYRNGNKLAAKILDFGLAKPAAGTNGGCLTNDGTMLGTPEYVSPEQMLNAAKSDVRSDIYSLGCTLYHMLIGHPPFRGTIGEVMMAHAQSEAPMVHVLRLDIPIELSEIVAKMMSKDPQGRFQLPSEVSSILKSLRTAKTIVRAIEFGKDEVEVKAPETNNAVALPHLDTSVEVKSPPRVIGATLSKTDPSNEPSNPHQSPRSKWRQWGYRATIAGVLGLLIVFGLSSILRIKTAAGTLVFENLPSDSEIQVDGKNVLVTWSDGKESAVLTIAAGSHAVSVRRGDIEVEGRSVTVRSGEKLKWSVKGESLSEQKADVLSNNKNTSAADEKTKAENELQAGIDKLQEILLEHEWFYRDSLFPPGANESFRTNGSFGNWNWNYWVVGPREIRVHYDRNNHNSETGIPMYFNDDFSRFFGEFTDGKGKFHQITGIRQ